MGKLNWPDYQCAVRLARADVPFYALVAAAMMRADTENLRRLRDAFPVTYNTLQARYDQPGGLLEPETLTDTMRAMRDARWLVRA